MFNDKTDKCENCYEKAGKYMVGFSPEDVLLMCGDCKKELDEAMEALEEDVTSEEAQQAEDILQGLASKIKERRAEQAMSAAPTPKGILDSHGVNLNKEAQNGKIDAVIGRDAEMARLSEIVSRRTKNNPVLVGESGVGKTAIAEGIALMIETGKAPLPLKGKTIIRLEVSSLLQGTGFRGQLEEKMQQLIKEMANAQDTILFIDELHLLVGAGTGSRENKGMDISNILKPALARGEFQVIGATTTDEFRIIEKDPALARRFQKVTVKEPALEDNHLILKGIRKVYEDYHHVTYTEEALKAATSLSKRYIQGRFLPDKAIDLMDEAGAKLSQSRQNEGDVLTVDASYIADLVEKKTGIPVKQLEGNETKRLASLHTTLQQQVVGQEEATERVAQAIRRNRMGFRKNDRPIGNFLFVGPTGVGKTELAKTLSQELFGSRENYIRLDMSEYMEKHSVSRLIGSPPGYVGHDEPGQLTEAVRQQPYSLILIDEVEKAHPEVFNLFLQIMEDGRLTDSKGHVISFKDTLIIMTSNASVSVSKEVTIGFGSKTEEEPDITEALKETFRPELLNRFDSIIPFNALSVNHLKTIANIMLKSTFETMAEHGVTLTISDDVIDALVTKGNVPDMGARPLRRIIEQDIENTLSEFFMDNPSADSIHLAVHSGQIVAIEQMRLALDETMAYA